MWDWFLSNGQLMVTWRLGPRTKRPGDTVPPQERSLGSGRVVSAAVAAALQGLDPTLNGLSLLERTLLCRGRKPLAFSGRGAWAALPAYAPSAEGIWLFHLRDILRAGGRATSSPSRPHEQARFLPAQCGSPSPFTLAVGPHTSSSTSLCLSFLIGETGTLLVSTF